jgi:hypothetical protein
VAPSGAVTRGMTVRWGIDWISRSREAARLRRA